MKVCDRRGHPNSFEYNGERVVAPTTVREHRWNSQALISEKPEEEREGWGGENETNNI